MKSLRLGLLSHQTTCNLRFSLFVGFILLNVFTNTAFTDETIFFDDFSDGNMDGWTAGDRESGSGYDYWGVVTQDYWWPGLNSDDFAPHPWCAKNTDGGAVVWEHYDSDMDAYMSHEVDLTGYQNCYLEFDFFAATEAGLDFDWLGVRVFSDGTWSDYLWTFTGQPEHGLNDHDWYLDTIVDLSAFDGQNISISFDFISDGSRNDISWGGDGAWVDNIGVYGTAPNNDPVLYEGNVDPDSGKPSQLFTYLVRYTDEDGDMPSVCKVYIDGDGHDMEQHIGDDPTVGIWYKYETYGSDLGSGSHNYYFYFEDGEGGSGRLPSGSETYSGPDVYCSWSLIYYCAHGNDFYMDDAGIPKKFDTIQIASSSNKNFQAFMLWDRLNDAAPDRLYRIYNGSNTYWSGPDIGLASEFDMADPATLLTCVDWVMDNYDTDHYALVTFNHGQGIHPQGMVVAAAYDKPLGVCWDGSDYLSVYELGLALRSIETLQGPKLEIFHLDACLMQMIEVNYQISDYVDHVVGYENQGWFSWDETFEDEYLASITVSTQAQSLAVSIAQAYDTLYDEKNLAHTISVLRESQTGGVVNNLHNLASALIDNMWDVRGELSLIRHYTQKFDYNTETPGPDGIITQFDDYLDLKDMAIETYNRCSNSDVQAAASALRNAIGNEGGVFVEFEEHLSVGNYNFDSGTYGVSIYWPDSADNTYQDYIDITSSGSQLELCEFTNWDEFLQAYLEWKAMKVTSSGASGVSITCTTDELNHSDGVTPFTRVYEVEKSVSLGAPPSAGGKPFMRWDRDGSIYSTDLTIQFSIDDDYHFEAVYGMAPPTAVITSISPSPADPQTDTVEFREDSHDNDEVGCCIVAWEWSSNLGDWQGNSVLSTEQEPDISANDLKVGTHTITLLVEDNEEETDTTTDTLVISNVTPVIESLNVTQSGSETVNITGTAHDRDEHQQSITDWEITVIGDVYEDTFAVGSGSLNYDLDTSCLAVGSYTVSARAKDDEFEWSESVLAGVFEVNSLSPDFDGNGDVNYVDLDWLSIHWLYDDCSCPEWCDSTDLDKSGSVDFADLAILANNWNYEKFEKFYDFALDTDPGWSTEGQWAFGQPTGGGSAELGNPDPTSGYSGLNVYGVNLNGDYSVVVGGPYHLSAGPFDCSGYHNIRLKFARWLNTDESSYVSNKTEVSNNGSDWSVVWDHTSSITDDSWEPMECNISDIADRQSTVYIRWSYEILDSHAFQCSGWNIDDVELWGNPEQCH